MLLLIFSIYSPILIFIPLLYISYKTLKQGKWNILQNNFSLGLFILFVWSFISGLINEHELSILASFVIFFYLMAVIYLQNNFNTIDKIERLLSQLFYFSLGSAFVGILEYFDVITYQGSWWKYLLGTRWIIEIMEKERISATFANPNNAGTWFAIMILLGFYKFSKAQGSKKLFLLLSTLLYFFILLATASRGALIALVFGFIVYAYYAGHKKKMFFLLVSVLSLIALMLFQPEWFPRGNILYLSIMDRKAIWLNSYHLFMANPITGWGIMGMFDPDPTIYRYLNVPHAHNAALSILVMLGVVGLFIVIFMLWSLLQSIRILYQHNCQLTPLLSGIQGIIFVHGVFDFTIMSPQIALLYLLSSIFLVKIAEIFAPALILNLPSVALRDKKWYNQHH